MGADDGVSVPGDVSLCCKGCCAYRDSLDSGSVLMRFVVINLVLIIQQTDQP